MTRQVKTSGAKTHAPIALPPFSPPAAKIKFLARIVKNATARASPSRQFAAVIYNLLLFLPTCSPRRIQSVTFFLIIRRVFRAFSAEINVFRRNSSTFSYMVTIAIRLPPHVEAFSRRIQPNPRDSAAPRPRIQSVTILGVFHAHALFPRRSPFPRQKPPKTPAHENTTYSVRAKNLGISPIFDTHLYTLYMR